MNTTCNDLIRLNHSDGKVANISELFHEIFTHFIGLAVNLNDTTPLTIQ